MIEILLAVPIITALLCFFGRRRTVVEVAAVGGAFASLLLASLLSYQVFTSGAIQEGALFMDAFSAYTLLLVTFIGLLTCLYSVGYMGHEYEAGEFGFTRLRSYYVLLQVFILTMVLVTVSNNLGIMWIAIEATTLASAFLVGFYEKDTSVEAAWKYIIICSVGITLALLGIILFYASSIQALGEASNALDWTTLNAAASRLDPSLVRIAFILVLLGYGTKVGLAPMHTWLPDAHSQAPTPVSALLSGVLLNCAMYGILRFHIITSGAIGPGFSGSLLLIFGLLSLAIAAAFIILSRDYKRLLAYSSIEHMGIIAIGFGFGGFYGILGGLLHMLNHALTKSMLFFGAGNVLLRFKTKSIEEVRGLGKIMPITAILLLGGALAITGTPPFSIFVSEFTILTAGAAAGNVAGVALYLFFLALVFAAFMYHVGRMVFGAPSEGLERGEVNHLGLAVMVMLFAAILITGVFLPTALSDVLNSIVRIFNGGTP
jgi:hydrogenase-4 component F